MENTTQEAKITAAATTTTTTTTKTTTTKKATELPSIAERRFKLAVYGIGCELWFGFGLLVFLQWFLADKGEWKGLPGGLNRYITYGVIYSNTIVDLLARYKQVNRYHILQSICQLLFMLGIIEAFPQLQQQIVYPILIMVWSSHKFILYFYEAVKYYNGDDKVDDLLAQFRFSWFQFLFPLSVGLEGFLAWKALPFAKQISDVYFFAIVIGTTFYIPGFPYLFQNMLLERRRYLIDKRNYLLSLRAKKSE
ncbi:unnamed protein product [Cunninghamella blakesleeana]